jgi:DNA polymerase III gamma/tau subunit
MGNPAVFAKNLQRLVERTGRTRRELAPEDTAYKRLSRWLTVGLERPNNALYDLCRQLGVWDIDALWDAKAEEKEKADADWGTAIRRLVQTHRENESNYWITGLLQQVIQVYHATVAAEQLAKDRPDLGRFTDIYHAASEWAGMKSPQEVYERLVIHLEGKRDITQTIQQEIEKRVGEMRQQYATDAEFHKGQVDSTVRQIKKAIAVQFDRLAAALSAKLEEPLEAADSRELLDPDAGVGPIAPDSLPQRRPKSGLKAEWKQTQKIVEKLAEHPNWTDYVERRFGGDDDAAERSVLEEWRQEEGSVTLEDFCGDYSSRWLDS